MTDQVLETGAEYEAPAESHAETPAVSLLDSMVPEQVEQAAPEGEHVETPEFLGFDAIPEQFRVMDGEQLNYAMSAEKLAKAYAERAAFGDIPESYSAPEGMEETWEEAKELPALKHFAEQAKELGMTDKQFSFALQHIGAAERDGRNFSIQQGREEAEKVLREEWREPDAFNTNLRLASHAVQLLVPENEREAFGARYGNDATVLKLLARIGSEMAEDPGIGGLSNVPTGEDVQTLMRSEAYQNSAHPDHKSTHAKVQRYYEKQYGNQVAL